MAEANMPEEIIVLILSLLPVKSLIRFTCVSKRFQSLILSDPKFAKSQFQAARDRKTLTQRLLYSSSFQSTALELGTLDLETPSFGDPSSVRKLKLPFQPPDGEVNPLGSCNGILFIAFDENIFYMWNPSTGFFKKLPHPGFSNDCKFVKAVVYAVGYLPATDDYKGFVVSMDIISETYEAAIYSSRSHAWETLQIDFDLSCFVRGQGILLNEALHWLDQQNEILAFDLAQEEHKFRTMLLPRDWDCDDARGDNYVNRLGVSAGGCLSVVRHLQLSADCFQLWVMREYGVRDSWTKLYNLKLSDPPEEFCLYTRVLVLETGVFACIRIWLPDVCNCKLVKILQKEEDDCSFFMPEGDWLTMIHYEESLLQIGD